jgi:hypothetical protein
MHHCRRSLWMGFPQELKAIKCDSMVVSFVASSVTHRTAFYPSHPVCLVCFLGFQKRGGLCVCGPAECVGSSNPRRRCLPDSEGAQLTTGGALGQGAGTLHKCQVVVGSCALGWAGIETEHFLRPQLHIGWAGMEKLHYLWLQLDVGCF